MPLVKSMVACGEVGGLSFPPPFSILVLKRKENGVNSFGREDSCPQNSYNLPRTFSHGGL